MSHGKHLDPVQHLNDDHADDLLAVARAFGGIPDATSAQAESVDSYGIDLVLATARGPAAVRVGFTEPVGDAGPEGLRAAFTELTHSARLALAAESNESNTP